MFCVTHWRFILETSAWSEENSYTTHSTVLNIALFTKCTMYTRVFFFLIIQHNETIEYQTETEENSEKIEVKEVREL